MKPKPKPPKYLVISNGWMNEWSPDIDSGHKSIRSATAAIIDSNEAYGNDEMYVYELRLRITPEPTHEKARDDDLPEGEAV